MRSDKVLLALVGVLGIAITGITVGGIIAALRGDPLSPETVTLVGTVVGALVGGITGALVPRAPEVSPNEQPSTSGERQAGNAKQAPDLPALAPDVGVALNLPTDKSRGLLTQPAPDTTPRGGDDS
jgi:hypothetical protein